MKGARASRCIFVVPVAFNRSTVVLARARMIGLRMRPASFASPHRHTAVPASLCLRVSPPWNCPSQPERQCQTTSTSLPHLQQVLAAGVIDERAADVLRECLRGQEAIRHNRTRKMHILTKTGIPSCDGECLTSGTCLRLARWRRHRIQHWEGQQTHYRPGGAKRSATALLCVHQGSERHKDSLLAGGALRDCPPDCCTTLLPGLYCSERTLSSASKSSRTSTAPSSSVRHISESVTAGRAGLEHGRRKVLRVPLLQQNRGRCSSVLAAQQLHMALVASKCMAAPSCITLAIQI